MQCAIRDQEDGPAGKLKIRLMYEPATKAEVTQGDNLAVRLHKETRRSTSELLRHLDRISARLEVVQGWAGATQKKVTKDLKEICADILRVEGRKGVIKKDDDDDRLRAALLVQARRLLNSIDKSERASTEADTFSQKDKFMALLSRAVQSTGSFSESQRSPRNSNEVLDKRESASDIPSFAANKIHAAWWSRAQMHVQLGWVTAGTELVDVEDFVDDEEEDEGCGAGVLEENSGDESLEERMARASKGEGLLEEWKVCLSRTKGKKFWYVLV